MGIHVSTREPEDRGTPSRLAANKRTVHAFYEPAYNNKDFDTASELVEPHYIQHNPLIADGIGGLRGLSATYERHSRSCAPRSRTSSPIPIS
jgi:predicted SnoaL-like aldol condensation-catalyzing enzyme